MKKNVYEEAFYKRFENYKPIAVRQYIDESQQTRYSWGSEEDEKHKDDMVWKPALGNQWHHLDLEGVFLMKKDRAEKEAKEIAKHLAKAFK